VLERDGEALWAAVTGAGAGDADPFVVEVLRGLVALDAVGDVLATWAVDRAGERPDAAVDDVVADVTRRLEALGVEREERPMPGPGGRPRGGPRSGRPRRSG
jgi:hypothetical protein